MRKPHVLKKGDKIGIVAPGAQFSKENFKTGIKLLKSWGLIPVLGKDLFKKDFIFAGTVKQRTQSFLQILKRKDIKAIWCVRGGYGSYSVADELSKINLNSLKKLNPKIFIGLSDNTALHLLINQELKWNSIHGPTVDRMGISVQPQKERDVLRKTLFDENFIFKIESGLKNIAASKNVSGILTGGNLSLLCSSIGSPWEVKTRGSVLFFEDIGEPSYRLDRMITQLKNAGKFDGIKALLLGDFTVCKDRDQKERWKEVLNRHFSDAKFPVILGVKSGHGDLRLPLPLGCKVKVNGSKKVSIVFSEPYGK